MNDIAKPPKRLIGAMVAFVDSAGDLLLLYGGLVVLAALGFAHFEQRTLAEGLWWAVVTTTGTGYGDYTPVTAPGRLVGAAAMLGSMLFVLPLLIGYVATAMIRSRAVFTHEEQEEMKTELAAIRAELAKLNARGS